MEGKFQTSFIPKKPVVSAARARGSGMSLFMVVSIFLFIVSLALAGLVFGGQRYLKTELEKEKASFSKAQEDFDSVTVETLVKLDNRIESGKKILGKHIAILPIFDFLESKTLRNVRFNNVEISFLENGGAKINMKGEAKNFSAVALQSDVFAESKELKNPLISDIDLSLSGAVTFNFTGEVNPSAILYKNTIANDASENNISDESNIVDGNNTDIGNSISNEVIN
ncbi:MAG: hypothetical protein HW401_51 [Parcubacteria group bacterium]|nr:hypothetical protein [Parcubacteria group bacterium]